MFSTQKEEESEEEEEMKKLKGRGLALLKYTNYKGEKK